MKHDIQNFLKFTIDNLENLLEFPKRKSVTRYSKGAIIGNELKKEQAFYKCSVFVT